MTSGWWDLNPRSVAAATALLYLIKLVSTFSGLVISLASQCFRASRKAFTVDKRPWHAVFRCLGFTGIMAPNSLSQIFARTDIAASGFLTAQHVTIKHSPLTVE